MKLCCFHDLMCWHHSPLSFPLAMIFSCQAFSKSWLNLLKLHLWTKKNRFFLLGIRFQPDGQEVTGLPQNPGITLSPGSFSPFGNASGFSQVKKLAFENNLWKMQNKNIQRFKRWIYKKINEKWFGTSRTNDWQDSYDLMIFSNVHKGILNRMKVHYLSPFKLL